jgi:hypothetical protein
VEITYSEDVVIKDETLLATLSIFCDKIYLPFPPAEQYVKALILQGGGIRNPLVQQRIKGIISHLNHQNAFINDWNMQHEILFKEGVLQYLPPPLVIYSEVESLLKDSGKYDSAYNRFRQQIKQINLAEKDIYTVITLTNHLWRIDLPGYEFFEGSRYASEIKLSRDIFFIELPKIMTDYRNILELRKVAKDAGISEFWAMIKEQTEYADANSESYLARAEKVRIEFKKWCNNRWNFRGKTLAVIGLVGLAFVNSNYTPLATIAGADWIGELNRNWAQRKDIENKAFKFISRLHGKIQQLTNRQ